VILTIAIMVSLTVGVMAYVLAPRMGEGALVFRDTPDPPAAFGCRMAWLAIRTRDTEAVVDALGLAAPEPCNWSAGIGTVYDDTFGTSRVYVTPSVNGWTFAVGLALPHPVGRMFVDKCTPLLLDLGRRFAEVQYFFTYPPIDLYAWARIIDGRLVRACAIGDEGILWRKGHPTREERALGLRLFEFRGLKGRHGDAGGEMILYPTEDHVLRIAGRWSLDPTRLDEAGFPPGLGYIASAPAAWRPERLRRTA
jgi:hypothetical protein